MTYPEQPNSWNDPSLPAQQPMTGYPEPGNYQAGAQPTPGYPEPGNYQVSAQPTAAYPDPMAYQVSGQPVSAAGQPAPAYGYPAYGYPAMPVSQPTNSLAIVALVLSLVGIASCITAPIGAIMGHVARRQIRERGEGGDGMALAGIIVGWIVTGGMLLLLAIYVVIIVVAVNSSASS